MKYVTIAETNQLIDRLRAQLPNRPLSYGEALNLATDQAFRVRLWLNVSDSRINLAWLLQQRAVPVMRVPRYKLGENTSGMTTDQVDGRLRMFINQNEPHVRQRFTLAHELKHAIDFYVANTLYARIGSGSSKRRAEQIEAICNHFAACLLMPAGPFKSAWFRTQDIELVANLFHVSQEAVSTRIAVLGLRDKPHTTRRSYFRRAGWGSTPFEIDFAALNSRA